MADQSSVQSFREFVQSLSSARHDEFRARLETKVESAEAFEAMRQYLLGRYQGVEARHTFMESGGLIVDCIPAEQQPSVKSSGQEILEPPSPPRAPPPQPDTAAPAQLHPDQKDRFGNQMWCPVGTIPVIRVTLDQLSRHRNLQDFFRKAPGGGRFPDKGIDREGATTHKYADAYQFVNALGGASIVNVWKPPIVANQIFSLSQQWYAAPGERPTQTVECGWQVYPIKYNSDLPRLFIYWTPDGYKTGCYNLDCPAFVQTNPNVVLGGALNFSQPGGAQIEYPMGYRLAANKSAWWFYVSGAAVGYYPAKLFRGGPLSSYAERITFGGETTGNGTWPPMGSGEFPKVGLYRAAYQRNVEYFPVDGGSPEPAELDLYVPSPDCYQVFASTQPGWGTYFYFGGPGGTNC